MSDEAIVHRQWISAAVTAWLFSDQTEPPLLLLRGDPGSGKSTFLSEVIRDPAGTLNLSAVEPILGASVLRGADNAQPFDQLHLLQQVVTTASQYLAPHEISPGVPMAVQDGRDLLGPLEVQINVDSAQQTQIAGVVLQLASTEGLQSLADGLIRKLRLDQPFLVVLDALDQAEDIGAAEFLATVARLADSARTTPVRILASSRFGIPLGFDTSLIRTLDISRDGLASNSAELRSFLERRLASLEDSDRSTAVELLHAGASGNWLWAATNATELLREVNQRGHAVRDVHFTAGLDGLHGDGVRRIEARVTRDRWRAEIRPVLSAVAGSVEGWLGVTELRWITGLEESAIDDVQSDCEPFLLRTGASIRVHHPDFARWVLGGNITGITEAASQALLANGLMEFGRQTDWSASTDSYAARRVLDHWIAAIILDPFDPNNRSPETEIAQLISDPRWLARAGAVLSILRSCAMVLPSLKLPNTDVPLGPGLEVLARSEAAEILVGVTIGRSMTEEQTLEFDSLLGDEAAALAWLEDANADYRVVVSNVLWGGVLAGHFRFEETALGLLALATPAVLVEEVRRVVSTDEDARPELYSSMVSVVAEQVWRSDPGGAATALSELEASEEREGPNAWVLSHALGMAWVAVRMASVEPDVQDDAIAKGCGLFRRCLEFDLPSDRRLEVLGSFTDVIRGGELASESALDELIDLQREIVELRRAAQDDRQAQSRVLLGHALWQRAAFAATEADRESLTQRALQTYREAIGVADQTDDGELQLGVLIALANALIEEEWQDIELLRECVEVNLQLRDLLAAGDTADWVLASLHAGRSLCSIARREGNKETADRLVREAMVVLREAIAPVPRSLESPHGKRRLDCLVELANGLMQTSARSNEELDELIVIQNEIVMQYRALQVKDWHRTVGLLGVAYSERSMRVEDPVASAEDRAAAVALLTGAYEASSENDPDSVQWLMHLIAVLDALPSPRKEDLDSLVESADIVLSHIGDSDDGALGIWLVLASALSSRSAMHQDEGLILADVVRAIESSRQALGLAAELDDHTRLLDASTQLANLLMRLPSRSRSQLDELIELQQVVAEERRSSGNDEFASLCNLLGDTFRERAAFRTSIETRAEDMVAALRWYRTAVDSAAESDEMVATYRVDLANALVASPAEARSDGSGALEAAIEVLEPLLHEDESYAALAGLVPILTSALRRRGRWPSPL